jgi:hypothetical protein
MRRRLAVCERNCRRPVSAMSFLFFVLFIASVYVGLFGGVPRMMKWQSPVMAAARRIRAVLG